MISYIILCTLVGGRRLILQNDFNRKCHSIHLLFAATTILRPVDVYAYTTLYIMQSQNCWLAKHDQDSLPRSSIRSLSSQTKTSQNSTRSWQHQMSSVSTSRHWFSFRMSSHLRCGEQMNPWFARLFWSHTHCTRPSVPWERRWRRQGRKRGSWRESI